MNALHFKNISRTTLLRLKDLSNSSFIQYRVFPSIKICDAKDFGGLRRFSKKGPIKTKIYDYENRLEVQIPHWPRSLNFSYIWLRDHCQCPQCYNQNTFQRTKDVYEIPMSIRPASVTSTEKELSIEWPDGHSSKFEFKFLWQNTYEGKRLASNVITPSTWTKQSFPAFDTITVPYKEFKEKKGQAKLVEAILKFGAGIVSEVTPTAEGTREVVEKLCPVKRTFYGEMWAFKADLEYSDSAYSNEYLGPHTDTTYLTEASRIQVFHCLEVAKQGGETLLVDGFYIADQLNKRDPKSYSFLSDTVFPCEYIGDDQHYMNVDAIFKHSPVTKRIKQFRYNIYDRAPLSSIPFEKIQEYYIHLHNLTTLIRRPVNEFRFSLTPGNVLFVDNWRVMHGRTAYEGPRIMGGCYLDNSDFTSKARTLGLQID